MVISIRGGKYWLWRAVDNEGEVLDFLVQRRRDAQAAKKLMVKLLKKYGFAPSRVVTDRLRSYPAAFRAIGLTAEYDRGLRANNGRRTRISQYDAENANCSGSNHPAQPNVSLPSMPPHSTYSPINVICWADGISRGFAPVHSALGPRHPPPHDACCPLHSPQLNANNVTKPSEARGPLIAADLGCSGAFGVSRARGHRLELLKASNRSYRRKKRRERRKSGGRSNLERPDQRGGISLDVVTANARGGVARLRFGRSRLTCLILTPAGTVFGDSTFVSTLARDGSTLAGPLSAQTKKSSPSSKIAESSLVSATISEEPGVSLSEINRRASCGISIRSRVLAESPPFQLNAIQRALVSPGSNGKTAYKCVPSGSPGSRKVIGAVNTRLNLCLTKRRPSGSLDRPATE